MRFIEPLFIAAAIAVVSIPAYAQPTRASCTAQWLEKRHTLPIEHKYDQSLADKFGRSCLGITKPVPIDWAKVRADLAILITTDHPLVSIVPADIRLFCPAYAQAAPEQRRDFWQSLTYEVIKLEAGTNAHAIMWEQPMNLAGTPLDSGEYSIGLLQLSISNRRLYGCDIPTEASLLDPTRNVQCGIKIVSYLVLNAGRIGGDAQYGRVGMARYWSTVRVIERKPKRAGKRDTRRPLIDALLQLPQCHSTT